MFKLTSEYSSVFIMSFIFLLLFSCNNTVLTTNNALEKPREESAEEIKQCKEVARKILVSSPRYQIIAQKISKEMSAKGKGHIGLEIESSPFDSDNQERGGLSGAYYFSLYEMDQDKQLNIARFIFIYKMAVLYEVDPATNKMKELEFDTELLKQYTCSR